MLFKPVDEKRVRDLEQNSRAGDLKRAYGPKPCLKLLLGYPLAQFVKDLGPGLLRSSAKQGSNPSSFRCGKVIHKIVNISSSISGDTKVRNVWAKRGREPGATEVAYNPSTP